MNKKALITGGAGFIGFHLAKYLIKNGRLVTISDDFSRGKKDSELENILIDGKTRLVQCDLTNKDEFQKLEQDYDEVYHLAAINGTKFFYEKPHEVLRVNVQSVLNILEWFPKNKKGKILFSSSCETYAGNKDLEIPTPEDIPLCVPDVKNSRWSYGGSKIVGELLFINFARAHNLDFSIVRYHNIYGPRMGYEQVIPEFFLRVLRKENPFVIKGGENTRTFCYIDDAIEATERVMNSDKTNGEIVHIGNQNEEILMKDLAEKIFNLADYHPDLKILPAPEGSTSRRCPKTKKLEMLTGFKAKVPLKEGLKRTFEWYKNDFNSNTNV